MYILLPDLGRILSYAWHHHQTLYTYTIFTKSGVYWLSKKTVVSFWPCSMMEKMTTFVVTPRPLASSIYILLWPRQIEPHHFYTCLCVKPFLGQLLLSSCALFMHISWVVTYILFKKSFSEWAYSSIIW